MQKPLLKSRFVRWCLALIVGIAVIYGLGRLYYETTDGFLVSNTQYDLPYDVRWEMTPLSPEKKLVLSSVLSQPYHYLGKGCQSYVFESEDRQYVIKFFKYQRFKPQEWLSYFSFIPSVEQYRLNKIAKKKNKLDSVFISWKIAYESLQPETGVLYVHLNKVPEFEESLTIFDKIGMQHAIDLNKTEFLVQKKAAMLCPTLEKWVKEGNLEAAKRLLVELLNMLVMENVRGFADNDHALMQNTGVLDGRPVHVDVGQFVKNPIVQTPEIYHQEIFNKTYKFRKWLRKTNVELANDFDKRLEEIIGEQFKTMQPVFYTADMARIPNA